MRHMPRPQEIYRHFKGNLYQIITVAEHSETGEQLVIYQALYGEFRIYARPLAMFMEKADREKYPDAPQEYRFEIVEAKQKPAEEGNDKTKAGYDRTEDERAGNETLNKSIEQEAEETNLDPMVLEFLDASTYAERLNILAALHFRITDDMINVMAMATDIEVRQGDVEERYAELRSCLQKLERFECNRLR